MNRVLLSAAAAALFSILPSAPACAGHSEAITIPDAKSFGEPPASSAQHQFNGNHRFHRGRGGRSADIIWGGYDLQSSYDDRDWAPETGNDWWHDRPDRAFPRWVQHNENCTPDRMWWSGSGWHC
jgi:hypothetical protein